MLTPTVEQEAIINAAKNTTDNLLISALAGSAKTTTLVMIAKALPDVQMLCCAFNKRIAEEMVKRLPANCTAKTLNAIGHRTFSDAIGRRCQIDKDKVYTLTTDLVSKFDKDTKKAAMSDLGEIMKIIRLGKSSGWVPDGTARMRSLLSNDEFFADLDEEIPDWQRDLIIDVSAKSIAMCWQGVLDFDDQILMPTLGPGAFDRYPLVLVDEAQDLSPLNHAMLAKMAKRRLIAVGDEFQAIYGFRGAHENSMSLLRQQFSMVELPLSMSFRCPKAVVEAARWRAPRMVWPEWAKLGSVTHKTMWNLDDLPLDAAILCRNNAPLFSMAITLLKAGRNMELVGNDIGKNLIKVLKKFGSGTMSQAEVLRKIDEWKTEKLKKSRRKASIEDQAACLRVFAEVGNDLSAATGYAEHVLGSTGPVKLLTGHKAKGLEFDNVFILNASLISDKGQDPNLRYVMITRAKETLTYIDSENLTE